MPFETAQGVMYTPLVSESQDGPFYPLDSFSSRLNFMTDSPESFWFYSENADYHAVEIKSFKTTQADGTEKMVFIKKNKTYYLKLNISMGEELFEGADIVSATAKENYFAFNKTNRALLILFLMVAILISISRAKKNPNLFVRRIAGLEAIDDALGRATEMGRSVLFVHGIKPMSEVPTIAAVNILGRIAKKVAEFDTGDSIAEAFVLDDNGAFGLIGNARYGFYYVGHADWGSGRFNYQFVKEFYVNDRPIIGDALLHTKNTFAASAAKGSVDHAIRRLTFDWIPRSFPNND